MKRQVKTCGEVLGRFILGTLARLLFLSSVSSILVLLVFVVLQPTFIGLLRVGVAPALFMALSIYVLYYLEHERWGRVYINLGIAVVIPGIVASLVLFFGKEFFLDSIKRIAGDLGEQAVAYYFAALPTAHIVIFGFIVVGLVLIYVGAKRYQSTS